MNKISLVSIYRSNMFEYTCDNNTVLKTLEEAIKKEANLSYVDLNIAKLIKADLVNARLNGANLRGADLTDVNLNGANLRGADLIGANLTDVNLRGADLIGANLIGANLIGANLIGANLRGANLTDVNLNGANLKNAKTTNAKLPIYSKWSFSIENDNLNIGCKTKTFSEWKKWFEESEEEFSTERNTEDFKRIQAMFYAYEAYYNSYYEK